MMEIRRATPDDAREIAEIHVRTWQIAYVDFFNAEFLAGMNVDQREVTWRERLLADPAQTTLVAEEEHHILGFAGLGLNGDDLGDEVGELRAIYVDPDCWDRGVGTALIQAAEASLAAAGFKRAVLWTLGANQRTRRFYENRGWRFDGTSYLHEPTNTERVRYAKELSRASEQ